MKNYYITMIEVEIGLEFSLAFIDVVPFFRKSDEIRFVRAPDSGKPDEHLDHRKLQDFSANASYLKVILIVAILKLIL